MITVDAAAAAAVDAAAVRRAVHVRLLPPLFLVSLLCQLDRSNLAFAALQMDADLGISRTIHGLGSGLFFIGYLAQIPANMVCMALGPRRWLPSILAAWGAVAMCFAAVGSTASFLALRLLLGVAEAGAYPAIMYTLSLFYPARNLGLAFTCVTTATAVAGLLGAPLAAGLMSLDGLAGLRGWQILFLAEGFPPLLLPAALPFALPGSPLSAGFLTPAEQQWLWGEVNGQQAGIELVGTAGGLAAAGAEGDVPPRGDDIERVALLQPADRPGSDASPKQQDGQEQHEQRKGALYGSSSSCGGGGGGVDRGLSAATVRAGLLDRRVWHLAAVMLLIDVAMNAVNFWLPTLVKAALQGELQSDGGSGIGGTGGAGGAPAATSTSTGLLVKASLLSALPFCGAAVCMVANAHHARLRDERRLHTALPLLAAGLALAAVPLLAGAASPAPALAALTVAASGIWATHGPFFSWPNAFLDVKAAALGFALVKTGGAVGGFAGPFVVGAMADALHGYTGAMLLLAGVAVGAAGLVAVFDDRRR